MTQSASLERQPVSLSLRDNRSDGHRYEATEAPSLMDIEGAVLALDGDRYDECAVTCQDESEVFVGGGKKDQVVLLVYLRGQEGPKEFQLVTQSESEETQIMRIAGEDTPLASRYFVPKEIALSALRELFTSGKLHANYRWETADADELHS